MKRGGGRSSSSAGHVCEARRRPGAGVGQASASSSQVTARAAARGVNRELPHGACWACGPCCGLFVDRPCCCRRSLDSEVLAPGESGAGVDLFQRGDWGSPLAR